nr:5464_t:CDS:2 [Entrophospora candida]
MPNDKETFPTPGSTDDAKSAVSNEKTSKLVPTLDSPTIETIANLIKNGKVNNVIVMAGAGISTAAGIPDFRTPGTGIYDNLGKYNLPYPEAIFDINYFEEHPEPFFTLAKELYPGKYFPTLAHYFIFLLHRRNLLLRCFTQNIDTLERLTDLPPDLIVEAHGSFAESKCLNCKALADSEWMRSIVVDKGEIPGCVKCNGGLVKPCITFFGEMLPRSFFERLSDFKKCDLLIVIGTSLQVQPFASLIDDVKDTIPRLLINLEKVGETYMPGFGFDFEGEDRRDVFLQSTCDEGVKKLAKLCGWEDELQQLYTEGHKALKEKYGAKTITSLVDKDLEELVEDFEKISIKKASTITETKSITIEQNKDLKKDKDEKNEAVKEKDEKEITVGS